MSIPGDNAARTSRPVSSTSFKEWSAFDRLPFAVREALREAPFDYSATEVLDFFEQAAVNNRSFQSFFDSVKKDVSEAARETVQTIREISEGDLQPYWEKLGRRFLWSNGRIDPRRNSFPRTLTRY